MNKIAVQIGSVQIYWYSIILIIAFLIGGILALKEARKKGIKKEIMTDYFLYLVPFTLIGARIYYVLFNINLYSNVIDIFKVWEGGLAIHGGILAGILFTIYFCKTRKIIFLKLTDIMVISLIIGQAIGRWGNFFNQEAYGPEITLNGLKSLHIPQFIIDGMHINGVYYQPTFLYESLWCLLGFIILILIRKFKKLKIGELTSYYLLWYGIERFFVEGLRQDSLMITNLKIAQIISLIMIILGIILFEYLLGKGKNYEK